MMYLKKILKSALAVLTFTLLGTLAATCFAEEVRDTTADTAKKVAESKPAGLTEIVFILDKSGSMSGLESDTIGGFNSLIQKQKKESGRALVSTVLFNQELQVLHDRTPLESVAKLTDKDYIVGGSTALLDAVGNTINRIHGKQLQEGKEEAPDKTLFVIITDGLENSSREYNYAKVKQLISTRQEKDKWEFLFLGANIDAAKEAGRFGISSKRAVRYKNDSKGVHTNFAAVSTAMSTYRSEAKVNDNWSEEIAKDYEKREAQAHSSR